jgi:hypothetical protein
MASVILIGGFEPTSGRVGSPWDEMFLMIVWIGGMRDEQV